jgi:hypothetical protein
MSPYYKHRTHLFYGPAMRNWLVYAITAFAVGLSLSYCTIQTLVVAARVVG